MKRLGWTAVGAVVGGSALWAFSRFGKRAAALSKNAPVAQNLEEGEKAPSTAGQPAGPNPEFREQR
jgi:hypothetical protein